MINDHSGLPAAVLGGLIDKPVLHTIHGPLDGEGGAIYEQIARVAPQVGLHLDLDEPAQAEAAPPVGRELPERARLLALSGQPHRGDYLLFLGRMSPDKGCHRAIDVAIEAGLPLKIAGKMREPLEKSVLRRVRPAAPLRPDRVPRRGHARREGRAAPGRARDALPDRVGGAVRLVMIESMACGTPVIATRWGAVPEVIEHGRSGIIVDDYRIMAAIEEADKLDPMELVRYAQEHFSPERMVADLRAFRTARS